MMHHGRWTVDGKIERQLDVRIRTCVNVIDMGGLAS